MGWCGDAVEGGGDGVGGLWCVADGGLLAVGGGRQVVLAGGWSHVRGVDPLVPG